MSSGRSREASGSDLERISEAFSSNALRPRRSQLKPPARARSALAGDLSWGRLGRIALLQDTSEIFPKSLPEACRDLPELTLALLGLMSGLLGVIWGLLGVI